MTTLILAWRSLASRRTTALLSIIAIAVSISLFVGVERIRIGAKSSFLKLTSAIRGLSGRAMTPVKTSEPDPKQMFKWDVAIKFGVSNRFSESHL